MTKQQNDWELEDGRIVRLITPEELAKLPDGTLLHSIFGEPKVKGRDVIDADVRFGYLAFGYLASAAPSSPEPAKQPTPTDFTSDYVCSRCKKSVPENVPCPYCAPVASPSPTIPEKEETTRNSETLASFVNYCRKHPDHRFWQALRNWSKWSFVLGTNRDDVKDMLGVVDTFSIEGLSGTRVAAPSPSETTLRPVEETIRAIAKSVYCEINRQHPKPTPQEQLDSIARGIRSVYQGYCVAPVPVEGAQLLPNSNPTREELATYGLAMKARAETAEASLAEEKVKLKISIEYGVAMFQERQAALASLADRDREIAKLRDELEKKA